jgi:hypothetical protein
MNDGENRESYPVGEGPKLPEDAQSSPDRVSLDGFQVLSDPDADFDGGALQEKEEWYVADASGNRQGPFTLGVLRTRVDLGELTPDTLVWRQTLSTWAPAGSVPEVASLLGAAASIAPPPLPKARKSRPWAVLDQVFSDPVVIRAVGRGSLAAGVVTLMLSLALSYWGYTWFTGSAILFAVWVGCEAAGAMLEAMAELKR